MEYSPRRNFARPGWQAVLAGMLIALGAGRGLTQSLNRAPQWLRDGVVYEIFPRQFSAAGNLDGITARLDELHDLGVTILWLMPIHPIGVQHRKGSYGSPYAVRDYDAVNPDYGTKADLKRLVAEAHRRDMKVILDVVLLHTAWDSVLMQHPEFYRHDAQGRIISPMPEWTDVAALNFASTELRQYLIAMLKRWLMECDVDGYRCDTASMIPTSFWEEASAALKQAKPDLMLLAEADKPELLKKAFDIDYAWPLLNSLQQVLGSSAPASELQRTWETDLQRYPAGALRLNMTDNHDQARAVARFGVRGALAASVLTLTLDGVPMFYNGMEVGDATDSGDPSLFERAPILWQPKDRPPLRRIYRELIKLRASAPALRNGRVVWQTNAQPESLVTFIRRDDQDEFLIAINFSNRSVSGKVNLRSAAQFTRVKIGGMPPTPEATLPDLRLAGFEWAIFRRAANPMAAN